MTVTRIESDTETIEHLDFESAIVCEVMDECEAPAEYIVAAKCCGTRVLACEDCLFMMLDLFKKMDEYGWPEGRCVHCSAIVETADYLYVIGRVNDRHS